MSKAMQRALGVQLGLEDGDDTPEMSEAASENAAISESAVEVADATDEVVADDQAATELSEAHEKLEEVSEAIAEASENGGISKEAAVFAHLAIKNACGRFYGPAFAAAVPSVESFYGDSGRRRNTQIALEGIGQMLKSFWQAIVRQIKKMWASVRNWYERVLGAAPRLKKKAQSLLAKSGNANGTAEEKDMDLNLMHALNISGKAPKPSDAVSHIKALATTTSAALGDETNGKYEGVFEDFEKLIDAVEGLGDDKFKDKPAVPASGTTQGTTAYTAPKDLATAYSSFSNELTQVYETVRDRVMKPMTVSGTKNGSNDRFGTDLDYKQTNEMLGGSAIIVIEPRGTAPAEKVKVMRRTGPRFATYAVKPKDVDNSGSFKTMSGAEIRMVTEEVSDVCDHIITYKKSWEMREKTEKKMEAAANKAIANLEKDKDAPALKVRLIKDLASGTYGFLQNTVAFETHLINYSLKTCGALLNWCERSLAQYK